MKILTGTNYALRVAGRLRGIPTMYILHRPFFFDGALPMLGVGAIFRKYRLRFDLSWPIDSTPKPFATLVGQNGLRRDGYRATHGH